MGRGKSRREPEAQVHEVVDSAAETIKHLFLQFLCEYGRGNDPEAAKSSYSQQAQVMRNSETSSLFVDYMHVREYDEELSLFILSQYYRWEPYLRKAVFEFIRMEDQHYTVNDDAEKSDKEFFVCFYNVDQVSRIRDLKTKTIGTLASFSGTVTRTSEVRPELLLGGFLCKQCGTEVVNVEQQFKYAEPTVCPAMQCTNTNEWELSTEKSTFVDWQRVKVQENSDEIPAGSMPRGMDVILRHENVEQAKAGDRVVFTGTLIVLPDVSKFAKLGEPVVSSRPNRAVKANSYAGEGVRGLKALGVRELTYKLCFLACSVQTLEQRFNRISIRAETEDGNVMMDEMAQQSDFWMGNDAEGKPRRPDCSARMEFTSEEIDKIYEMRDDPDRYVKMAKSLCPAVYGHDEIRRGILLMLFGGVQKQTGEGIKLRGDLNVCIVGDPSTAKSQFLKYICSFLPRAIYTSGKVSTAAGLTASVMRDPETGEFCVEAGALMLADNGICCIDEFDKMEQGDQVAIHEAMEQQTISITKAGIHATLNARTSILAAANPYSGRYDRSKTLKYNVNISAPILSRFDLFFVILDECDEQADRHIAEHIVNVHKLQESVLEPIYSQEDLQRYIKYARNFLPVISPAARQVMVDSYRRLREHDVSSNGKNNIAYRITVRQLESMIRLSEALARLDLDEMVRPGHVREAFRLLQQSIIHVDTEEVQLNEFDKPLPELPDHQVSAHKSTLSPQSEPEHVPSTAQPTSLSFTEFAIIEKAIACYIRDSEGVDTQSGIQQGKIVSWYLSQKDIASESDLIHERLRINTILDRLIQDGTLIINYDTDELNPAEPSPNDDIDERNLSVHPNFDII